MGFFVGFRVWSASTVLDTDPGCVILTKKLTKSRSPFKRFLENVRGSKVYICFVDVKHSEVQRSMVLWM